VIVDAFVAGYRPLLPTIASCYSLAVVPAVDCLCHSWLLHSQPTQQDTDGSTKLKMFPVSTRLDLF
jgi:hypothetical protein